jgi:hypothetical protein
MAIDPSIILEASRNMPNFGATIVAGQEIARKREKENREIDRANKFASLQQTKPANMSMTDWLSSQGFSSEASELAKTQAETDKIRNEGNVKGAEYHAKRMENAGKVTQELVDRPDLSKDLIKNTLGIHAKAGLIDPEMYQGALNKIANMPDDPETLRSVMRSAISGMQAPKDQMSYMQPDANAQLTANMQMRGQNLTYGMNQQELGFNREKFGQEFGLAQGSQEIDRQYKSGQLGLGQQNFMLEQQKRQDALNPRTSGKPPTEFQGKSALYANRAAEAEKILSSLDYSPAALGTKAAMENTPLIGGVLGATGNMMLSADNQKAEQAQRNFVNAILRQESGAVISPAEFENAKKQYFPSVGDSEAVKTQKAENRRVAIESIRNNAEGVINTEPRQQHGATISWDDGKIDEFVSKNGGTPEQARAFLKSKGLL